MSVTYWSSNLKFLRNRKRLSQDDLATHLSITRVKLAAHEAGNTINPPIDDLINVSDFFRISIDHLLRTNLAKMSAFKLRELETGNDSYAAGNKVRVLATTVDSENNNNAEVVPVKAKAGYTTGYGDPEFVAQLPHFSLPMLSKDRKYRMFPISGDSMHPIPSGAFVIGEYTEDWTSLKPGTPAIVVTRQDGIVFKLVTPLLKDRVLQLVSLNELYPPYTVLWKDVLEVWSFKGLLTETLPEAETTLQQVGREVRELKQMFGKWGKDISAKGN